MALRVKRYLTTISVTFKPPLNSLRISLAHGKMHRPLVCFSASTLVSLLPSSLSPLAAATPSSGEEPWIWCFSPLSTTELGKIDIPACVRNEWSSSRRKMPELLWIITMCWRANESERSPLISKNHSVKFWCNLPDGHSHPSLRSIPPLSNWNDILENSTQFHLVLQASK